MHKRVKHLCIMVRYSDTVRYCKCFISNLIINNTVDFDVHKYVFHFIPAPPF